MSLRLVGETSYGQSLWYCRRFPPWRRPSFWLLLDLILLSLARRPRWVSDLCDDLDLNQSLVSWHLAILRTAGFVVPRQQRLFTIYEYRQSEFDRLVRIMRNSVL